MLLDGLSKLESEPDAEWGDVALVCENQVLCWSEYWYCVVGEGSIIDSRLVAE